MDTHETFRRQWLKRRAFYRKQKYRIVQYELNQECKEEEDNDGSDSNEEVEDVNKGKCLIKLRK